MVRAAPQGGQLSAPGPLAVLGAGDGHTLGAALGAWLDGLAGRQAAAVLAGGPEGVGNVPEQPLVDLLCGPLRIGAVVPLLHDEHGRTAAAGTFRLPSGLVAPFDAGTPLAAREHGFRRDVPGSVSAVVAVSARALDGLELDTDQPDAAATVREVLDHARASGFRTVYEPAWRAPRPSARHGCQGR